MAKFCHKMEVQKKNNIFSEIQNKETAEGYKSFTKGIFVFWLLFFTYLLWDRGYYLIDSFEEKTGWFIGLTMLYIPGRVYQSFRKLSFTRYDYKWIGVIIAYLVSVYCYDLYDEYQYRNYAIGSGHGAYVEIKDIVAIEDYSERRDTLHLSLVNGDKIEIEDPYFISRKYSRSRFYVERLRNELQD
jgi:hypothetical protein